MKIPFRARYDYCNQKSCEFLEEYSITSFPVNVEEIIHRNNWGLVKFSEIAKESGHDLRTIIHCLGSNDGLTIWDKHNYTISYNDSSSLGNRIRFTLMHEIGHIYLNHLVDFESTEIHRGTLTHAENRVLENEANAFARNVLAPTSILQQISDKSATNVAYLFGLTSSAAQTRLDFLSIDIGQNSKLHLENRLNKIANIFLNQKSCSICGHYAISTEVVYCPICGCNSFQRKENGMKYPINIYLDNNGKALKCPVCNNENIIAEGNYCHICGTYLVNHCTNEPDSYEGCGRLASGNARYCIYCGAETTFFKNGILKPWNLSDDTNMPSNLDDDILPTIDEELPFN